MKTTTFFSASLISTGLVLGALVAGSAACDNTDVPKDAPKTDSGTTPQPGTDSGGGTPGMDSGTPVDDSGKPLDCFPDPKTHAEIINRCSDSQKIDKKSSPPGLLPDGGLPPLP